MCRLATQLLAVLASAISGVAVGRAEMLAPATAHTAPPTVRATIARAEPPACELTQALVLTESRAPRTASKPLPGAPASAQLFLAALATVGAWQLARSARHVDFAAAPDWYHTGGRRQVGHVHALELSFTMAEPLAFVQVAGFVPLVESRCEPVWSARSDLPSMASRAPPSVASI